MSRAKIGIGLMAIGMTAALVVVGMMLAVIDPTEGPAWAASRAVETYCANESTSCVNKCNRDYEQPARRQACWERCADKLEICRNIEMESSKKSTDVGGTPVPPTKAGQNVGKVGGPTIDPGYPVPPPSKAGQNVGKAGGVKKVDEGWSSPSTSGGGTIMMQRSGSGKKH